MALHLDARVPDTAGWLALEGLLLQSVKKAQWAGGLGGRQHSGCGVSCRSLGSWLLALTSWQVCWARATLHRQVTLSGLHLPCCVGSVGGGIRRALQQSRVLWGERLARPLTEGLGHKSSPPTEQPTLPGASGSRKGCKPRAVVLVPARSGSPREEPCLLSRLQC